MADIDKNEKSPLAPIAHVAFVIVAAVGVYSFVSVAKEGESRRRCAPTCMLRPNYAGYDRVAPKFTLKDTKGHDVSLESYRGKVVVLNFWTKTCGPCMEEMPELVELTRVLKPKTDVAVLTVSTDETAEEATNALKTVLRFENGGKGPDPHEDAGADGGKAAANDEPPFTVLMDPDLKVVREKYGTTLYPETWIIDKNGVIRARFDGARAWSNAAVVEYVDQIRGGGYCPVQAKDGKFLGDGARTCEAINGG